MRRTTNSRKRFDDIEVFVKAFLLRHAQELTDNLHRELGTRGKDALKQEDERYRSRQGEVSALIAETTIQKLERELEKMKNVRQQGLLFDEAARLDELDRSMEEKRAEIDRRKRHYEDVRQQLEKSVSDPKHLLPRRHAMAHPSGFLVRWKPVARGQ